MLNPKSSVRHWMGVLLVFAILAAIMFIGVRLGQARFQRLKDEDLKARFGTISLTEEEIQTLIDYALDK